MTGHNHSRPAWRKSSHSGQNGNCIEVADHGRAIAVRDSKNPHGQHLAFPAATWRAFTRRVHAADLASTATCPSAHGQQAPSLWGCPLATSGGARLTDLPSPGRQTGLTWRDLWRCKVP
jgi:hypothetical protein